jgi:hypothetical protein
MDSNISEDKVLMDAAVTAVQRVRLHIFDLRKGVPSFDPEDTSALSLPLQDAALRTAERAYRERPELAAAHFCLASSIHLLQVCRSLLETSSVRTPSEELQHCNDMMFETKDAGREAYQAALILSELPLSEPRTLVAQPGF